MRLVHFRLILGVVTVVTFVRLFVEFHQALLFILTSSFDFKENILYNHDVMNEKVLDLMVKLSELFGNELRMRILMYLLERKEACVSDMVSALDIKQSTVSNQLKILKLGGVIKARREGKRLFYSLADSHISNLLTILKAHAKEAFYE